MAEGQSNILSCSCSSSGHLVNLLLGYTSGVHIRGELFGLTHFWFKSGRRPRTRPGLVISKVRGGAMVGLSNRTDQT